MKEAIRENFVYLTEHLNNLNSVLNHLFQNKVISVNEREEILLPHKTKLCQITDALLILQRKNWDSIGNGFIEILRLTGNNNCANIIQGLCPISFDNVSKLLKDKWWPEEKPLVNSFQERKSEGKLLVETLYEELTKSTSGMTVISQKITVSGFGGVGKTTLAKWYANYYENEYDYIIWVDCGEGSLYNSIVKLAADQKLENSSAMNLKEKATGSLEELSKFKCLLIYDNAESFFGNEGIRDVLPNKRQKNFHTIITSRNREWGNESGFGKMDEFHLDVFEEEDCILFFERNLQIEFQRYQLVELSNVLGYLPLALQIAVAALNKTKMIISSYIDRIRNTDVILTSLVTLDDYEKTIYKTMSISLEIIRKNEDFGELATNILLTLGYLRPDDNEAELFAEIENVPVEEIQNAADLLEQHSLIGKTVKNFGAISVYLLNVHRLLQQVLRCNGKSTESSILGKILQIPVGGFRHYKLIPYMFATKHEDLKAQCESVKEQMTRLILLTDLIEQRRFYEATNLSQIIYESSRRTGKKPTLLSRTASLLTRSKLGVSIKRFDGYNARKFNYAICLYMEKRLNEAFLQFESIRSDLSNLSPPTGSETNLGIVDWELRGEKPTTYAVDSWLVHLKILMGLPEQANSLVQKLECVKKMCLNLSCYYLNVPWDLSNFGISQTEHLRVGGMSVLLRDDDQYKSFFSKLYFKSISFNQSTFVDKFFNAIERINFHELPFRGKDMHISDIKNETHVNMSSFPDFVTRANFQNVYIHCKETHLCNLNSVGLKLTANEVEINKFLTCCPQLKYLSLSNMDVKTALELSYLPSSLTKLYLHKILVSEQFQAKGVKLEKLHLNNYSLDTVSNIITLVAHDVLTVSEFVGFHQSLPVSLHRRGMTTEGIEKLTNIINASDVIALRDSDLTESDGLAKYGIKVNDSPDFLISKGKGRKLAINETSDFFFY